MVRQDRGELRVVSFELARRRTAWHGRRVSAPLSPDDVSQTRGENPHAVTTARPGKAWLGAALVVVSVAGLSLATLAMTTQRSLTLRYLGPGQCVAAYLVEVDERFEVDGYGAFYNRSEEHSRALMAWAPGEGGTPQVRFFSEDAGVKSLRDPKASRQDLRRALEGDGSWLGPAAPDAACRDRSWDPLEDALALGFVQLPGHRVTPGQSWFGAPVRGDGTTCSARDACCSLGACLDAEQGRDRSSACVVGPWRERLERVQGGEATILSRWDDGRPGDRGARAERQVVFDVERGRVRSAEIELSHPFLGVRREISIRALDRCRGLQPATEDPAALTRAQALFEYKQPPGK